MHRSLAATVATFAAMAALSAGSTAPMAQAVTCEGQFAICLKTCTHFACKRKCNGPYQLCLYSKKETYKPGGAGATQNDAKPKKGIDGTPSGQWVPNSPGKGVPNVPAGGTWNPSPNSGGRAQNLK